MAKPCLTCPRLSPDKLCNWQEQPTWLWSQPSGSLSSSSCDELPTASERAALPGDLEHKGTGARDLFKELWEGYALFLKKNNVFGEFITTLDLDDCPRTRSTLLLRGMYCKTFINFHTLYCTYLFIQAHILINHWHVCWISWPSFAVNCCTRLRDEHTPCKGSPWKAQEFCWKPLQSGLTKLALVIIASFQAACWAPLLPDSPTSSWTPFPLLDFQMPPDAQILSASTATKSVNWCQLHGLLQGLWRGPAPRPYL